MIKLHTGNNAPQVCGVDKIILLLPVELEPPRSPTINIECLIFMIPRRAASDGSLTKANERAHVPATGCCLL